MTRTTQRCRRCGRRHRAWRTVASCRFPRLLWVSGDGPFASVSFCRPNVTIQLYKSQQEAEEARAFIGKFGCGGCCSRFHVVVDLAAGQGGDGP